MYPAHHAAMPQTDTLLSRDQHAHLLDHDAQIALQQVDNLKYFLISAPVDWSQDQYIRRFLLPTGEYVSCVLWNNLFHISGTDIVRCLSFRFQAFGRPVKNPKKFEEGIFSDLRNLKAGSDASLEEPKSPFLDFLYKNNCIRTQKKQKVFYWYSVPHDRLFLDALERDLKREKMGQEATTHAVAEPALSFEFDASQSLYDQLARAQADSSIYNAHAQSTSHSTSPVMRAADSMPPPQMIPQAVPPAPPQEHPHQLHHMQRTFTQMPMQQSMSQPVAPVSTAIVERDYAQLQCDRNGIPLPHISHRHSSMPTYMECSPAPSFVSSHYEDYSNRGISYEPITPPQHSLLLGAETAYIANEDTGLYTAIPDVGIPAHFNMMHLPTSNFTTPPNRVHSRDFAFGHPFAVIEGSPTYKQRRRRPSMCVNGPAAIPVSAGVARAAYRPSDLRRSMSSSVVPVSRADGNGLNTPQMANRSFPGAVHRKDLAGSSRHSTPQRTTSNSPAPAIRLPQHQHARKQSIKAETSELAVNTGVPRLGPSVVRRARRATMTEVDPYPTKSHACPIPTCGRYFKRLEHLKRHVRTHTQERPYICNQCNKGFSRSDNLAQHRRVHEAEENGASPAPSEDEAEEDEEHEAASADVATEQQSGLQFADPGVESNPSYTVLGNPNVRMAMPVPVAREQRHAPAIQHLRPGFHDHQYVHGFGGNGMMARSKAIAAEHY